MSSKAVKTGTAPKPLTPMQTKAARALGQGLSQKATAAACNRSDRTIRHWLKLPEFRALVDAEATETVREHKRGLALLLRGARAVIGGSLKAGNVDTALKIVSSMAVTNMLLDKEAVMAAVSGPMPTINLVFNGSEGGPERNERVIEGTVIDHGEANGAPK